MSTKLSSFELHHFKTGVLAEQRMNSGLPVGASEQVVMSEQVLMEVNYIRHLETFLSQAGQDKRLKSSHISLYLSLFHIWNKNRFPNQFPVIREHAMKYSKIGSANTYTDCLKWLHKCGYIIYRPPRQPYMPCQVSIISNTLLQMPDIKNDTHTGSKNDTPADIKNEPDPGSKMIHNYYNKQLNIKTESKQAPPPKKLISNEKEIPTMEATTHWFAQRGQTAQEARKFFYHYEALEWTFNGQPIKKWQAAAAKWFENIKIVRNEKPGRLHVDPNKCYSDPL